MKAFRESFGAFVSRSEKDAAVDFVHEMAGLPDGDYATVKMPVQFARKKSGTEVVVLVREGTGYKVIGYFIQ
jgi:hypothetical protein